MDFRITLLTLIISSCSPLNSPTTTTTTNVWPIPPGWIPPKERIEEDIFSDIAVARPKIIGDFFNPIKNDIYNTAHETRISNKGAFTNYVYKRR